MARQVRARSSWGSFSPGSVRFEVLLSGHLPDSSVAAAPCKPTRQTPGPCKPCQETLPRHGRHEDVRLAMLNIVTRKDLYYCLGAVLAPPHVPILVKREPGRLPYGFRNLFLTATSPSGALRVTSRRRYRVAVGWPGTNSCSCLHTVRTVTHLTMLKWVVVSRLCLPDGVPQSSSSSSSSVATAQAG